MRRALATIAVLAVAGVAAIALGGRYWLQNRLDAPGPAAAPVTAIIPKGAHLDQIATVLADARIIDSRWLLVAEARATGNPTLHSGEFAFPAAASMAAVLDILHRGQVVQHRLTIPEGLTSLQVVALVKQAEALRGGLLQTPAEGTLLPQTYFYVYDDPRDAMITRMTQAMSQTLDSLWSGRAANLIVADKQQALTLASIVERETSLPAERPHIAAVYENRLRLRMKLESDPTVIYAASKGEGTLDHSITRAELAIASPYNTYQVDGLPPGPICNPGRASIEAVLHPMASDDLYFVADGSGGHAFAKTLALHLRNVEHWRQIERSQGNGKGG
jgi:UPF0755 protein